jgi:hypothetical protein
MYVPLPLLSRCNSTVQYSTLLSGIVVLRSRLNDSTRKLGPCVAYSRCSSVLPALAPSLPKPISQACHRQYGPRPKCVRLTCLRRVTARMLNACIASGVTVAFASCMGGASRLRHGVSASFRVLRPSLSRSRTHGVGDGVSKSLFDFDAYA